MGTVLTTYKVEGKTRHRAWCDEHQDGYQGGKRGATGWADRHNNEHHPSTGGDKPVENPDVVFPDRDELALKLFTRDNSKASAEHCKEEFNRLKTEQGETFYVYPLADAALEVFKPLVAEVERLRRALAGHLFDGESINAREAVRSGMITMGIRAFDALEGVEELMVDLKAHVDQEGEEVQVRTRTGGWADVRDVLQAVLTAAGKSD